MESRVEIMMTSEAGHKLHRILNHHYPRYAVGKASLVYDTKGIYHCEISMRILQCVSN
jgi:hypothetical protein